MFLRSDGRRLVSGHLPSNNWRVHKNRTNDKFGRKRTIQVRGLSASVLIAFLNDFPLDWGRLGTLWLRSAGRSAEHGVFARWSHCRWCCNWVGPPCRTRNVTIKRLTHQHPVYDCTALQRECWAALC